MVMVLQAPWCELCRFDDLALARAVATSIASMEFDVRLCAIGCTTRPVDEPDHGCPPYIVQVDDVDVRDLADVLDEIIDEQREFDRMLAGRSRAVRPIRIMTVVTLTGAAELALILALMDW